MRYPHLPTDRILLSPLLSQAWEYMTKYLSTRIGSLNISKRCLETKKSKRTRGMICDQIST